MILSVDTETTFVVGMRVFSVRVTADQELRSVKVTVTLDGRIEWTFDEPGWRPLSLGVAADEPYLWSARDLIVLPTSHRVDPEVIRVDEDLLFVFRVDAGWLLVCETSVRLVAQGRETARLEIGEVVEYASWQQDELLVRDARELEQRIGVHSDRLIASDLR